MWRWWGWGRYSSEHADCAATDLATTSATAHLTAAAHDRPYAAAPTTVPTPQPAFDAHLALTNTRTAQALGFTGAGYRIGVVDSGINGNHPALQGRLSDSFIYVDPRDNNIAVGDVVGHGTVVAELAAGGAVGQWPGGIAPGAAAGLGAHHCRQGAYG